MFGIRDKADGEKAKLRKAMRLKRRQLLDETPELDLTSGSERGGIRAASGDRHEGTVAPCAITRPSPNW